jgi:hypothetical protein
MFKIGDKVRLTKEAERELPDEHEFFGKHLEVLRAGEPKQILDVDGVGFIGSRWLEPYPGPQPDPAPDPDYWHARYLEAEQRIAGFEEMLAAVKRAVEREVPNE